MSYTRKNFPTKKALKDAVASLKLCDPKGQVAESLKRDLQLERSTIYTPTDGQAFVEGPHFPKPHTWYANVRVEGGIVVRVVS